MAVLSPKRLSLYEVVCPWCARNAAQARFSQSGGLCFGCAKLKRKPKYVKVRGMVNYLNECRCGAFKRLNQKRCDACYFEEAERARLADVVEVAPVTENDNENHSQNVHFFLEWQKNRRKRVAKAQTRG